MSAAERGSSPTTQLWDARRQTQEKMVRMSKQGLHVFYPAWQALVDSRAVGSRHSTTFTETTLTISGTGESLTFPVQTCTRVLDLRESLANTCMCSPDEITFVVKQGSSYRKQLDHEEIGRRVVVKGITSFKPLPTAWPHPICILGAGYNGIKTACHYLREGCDNIVVFDRNSRVGGYCWITAANKTSKLQTEMGSFHVWWGLEYANSSECGGWPTAWETWPKKERILEHFHVCARDYGMLPHVRFRTNVSEMDIVGPKDAPERYYNLTVTNLDKVGSEEADEAEKSYEIATSIMYNYPGSMTKNRIIEFPGEDVFEGHIGYGMFNEFDYSQVRGGVPAIMGFGAFAVENIRTCLEKGAVKVWLVCRRKNIAMPRVMSWFMNQSLYPPPGAMVMDAMQLMYDLLPDDPWTYYGIMANKDRTTCTIRQKSRFGIGDVYFLAVHYQKAEVVVDGIKRLKPRQILLESGGKLDADHLIKVLGFKGDFSVDKVMGVREMVGYFVNGDFRRWICAEFPGIDAGKFGGTSFSPGGIQNAEFYTWFLNYPKDLAPVFDNNVLPRKKPDKEKVVPTYVWDPRQGSSIMMMLSGGIIPALGELAVAYGPLNRAKQLEAHPLEQFVDECADEWYGYCRMFKDAGDDRPFPPYPYTHSYVRELCRRNDEEGEADALRQAQRG